MTVLQTLYLASPYCLWLCLASALIALAVATGSARPMAPVGAALGAATVSAIFEGPGLLVETAVFLTLTGVAAAVAVRKASAPPRPDLPPARLVGRIARSSGEFANGVGRVWIDGMEWAAELDGADEVLSQGHPVRVTRVLGGVRLQVHPVAA